MGTTLREVIYDIGGGIPGGKEFKAAQTGGPSGGCIPKEHLDAPIDYENLSAIGCIMGSGGLIVMDEDNCMVDIAKFFLGFTVDESCGKCTPCRVGTKRMLEMLDKITSGNGEIEDLERLENLANYVKACSLCGLGQTAPNPVLSTIRFFRDEYIAHIVEKRCPASVCKDLLRYSIDRDKCIGCGMCVRVCPVSAISVSDYTAPGRKRPSYIIDPEKCIKCGACYETCKFGAIEKK
jgi:NADP-reducing hydrogenase subunit HndC